MTYERPQANRSGRRLHLSHGPINLILEAAGEAHAVEAAYQRAIAAFDELLEALVVDLPVLRKPLCGAPVSSPVALRMCAAVRGIPVFVTPMAAVAGSVADYVLAAMRGEGLRRVVVNNGGDIALWLGEGEGYRLGISDHVRPGFVGMITLDAACGVATSGWRGRSYSLGIADAVTVLARSAAEADVLATLIANSVDLPDSPLVQREAACALSPDSDLGARLVTVGVSALPDANVTKALDSGVACAQGYIAQGRASGVFLCLQGQTRVAGEAFALE